MKKTSVSVPAATETAVATLNLTEADFATGEAQASTVAPTEEIEIVIPTAEEKPAFERLPWKVLAPEAYEASQAHIQANHGRAPMAMAILAARSKFLGRSLSESDYREVVRLDKDIPETHQKCAYPGCRHEVPKFRTALVLNGEISKDRDGNVIWRGNFLVMKPNGLLAVEGFCWDHIFAARAKAEEISGKRQHPLPYAEACAKLQGILEAGLRHRENVDAFESRYGGSAAQRSTPRNSPNSIGDRRR